MIDYEGRVALLNESVLKVSDLEAAIAQIVAHADNLKDELSTIKTEQEEAGRSSESRYQMHVFNADNKLSEYISKVHPLTLASIKALVIVAAYSSIAQLLDDMRCAAQSPYNGEFFDEFSMRISVRWQSASQALLFAGIPAEKIDAIRNRDENPEKAPHDDGVPENYKQFYRYEHLALSRLQRVLAEQIPQYTDFLPMWSTTL
ncbi:MAG: hypothetical protein V4472_04090 [Pseudomonadota bacterium]